jgi:hypothetical protein
MDKLAIFGGTPVRETPYPSWPVFDDRDIQAVADVIRSGNWGRYPYPEPKSAQFALRFAEMQGGGHAVLMANGRVTMEVALRAMNIGWGTRLSSLLIPFRQRLQLSCKPALFRSSLISILIHTASTLKL